jgi:putative nucleotidyltransferase with HDIG domain
MQRNEKLVIETTDDSPLLIMMVGIPGSGKSTISNNIQVNRNGNLTTPKIHSSDALREEWYGDASIQGDNEKRDLEMKHRMIADMAAGKDIVYDATNISKRRRVAFINDIANIHCRPVCVCVMKPFDICLKDNESRAWIVPSSSMKKMYTNWNPPHYTEGFEQIIPVFNYGTEQKRSDYNAQALSKLFQRIDQMPQENQHHQLTLGHHCRETAYYVEDRAPENRNLRTAALLHDIGKIQTQTRGQDGQCHYYHHCVGAYEAMFYLHEAGFNTSDQLYISNLIYYHMKPYMSWNQSQKSLKRDLRTIGEAMYKDVLLLHEADKAAHTAKYITQSINKSANAHEEGEIELER